MLRVAKETVNPEIEFLAHNARFHCFLELCDRRGMDAETPGDDGDRRAAAAAVLPLAHGLPPDAAGDARRPLSRCRASCRGGARARPAPPERVRDVRLPLRADARDPVGAGPPARALARDRGSRPSGSRGSRAGGRRSRQPSSATTSWHAASSSATQAAASPTSRATASGSSTCARWPTRACSSATQSRGLQLYELLLPHDDDNAVSYTQQPFGPVALRLGKLAALLGRWQETDRHFATALARCELLGARAIRARVLLEHASALAARGEPADRGRLERDARARPRSSAHELGMSGLLERVAAVRERLWRDRPAMPRRSSGARESSGRSCYEGQTFRLRDVKGLRYHRLASRAPGTRGARARARERGDGQRAERRVRELVEPSSAARGRPTAARCSTSRRSRSTASGSTSSQDELEEARDWRDPERAAASRRRSTSLTQELAQAVGLRRPRPDLLVARGAGAHQRDEGDPDRDQAHRQRRAPRSRRTSRRRSRPGGSAPTRRRAPRHRAGRSDARRAERSFRRDSRPLSAATTDERSRCDIGSRGR